jgi:uncharacterized repeat protein (TIGR01451 family)
MRPLARFCGLSLRLLLILSLPLTSLTCQSILLSVTAQTVTSLTVTKITSTPSVVAGGAATYTIRVVNNSSNTVTGVTINDTLPTGFTYDATIGLPVLQNSAFRTVVSNPSSGSGSGNLSWGTFSLPPSASVSITFVANIPLAQGLGTYQNPVLVNYDDAAGAQTTSYNPLTSNSEDVTVVSVPPAPPAPPPLPVRSGAGICALPGKDGNATPTGNVNTYYQSGSVAINAGSQSMSIGASSGATTPITPGDLLLVIQMQDATINNSNTSSYGSGIASNDGSGFTSLGSTGLYEYVVATNSVGTAGGNLTFAGAGSGGGLINTYTNDAANSTQGQKRYQVIRVPQYSNLTLNSIVSAKEWDGNSGGIVLMDVAGQLNFNGRTIDGRNRGFRGGYLPTKPSGNSVLDYRGVISGSGSTTSSIGSGKGEGIAGTPQYVWNGTTALNSNIQGYPNGDAGRGAPGNAGGGGNIHNAGGGGGGNGGKGGQGGIPWEGAGGAVDAGGRGGSVISSLGSFNRLVLGGGGGGGDANNAVNGVRGGAGAGIVMIRAGSIVGNGTIDVSGTNGDPGVYSSAPDGAGGGGAGGTVYITARQSSTATININAQGGMGGNTLNDSGGVTPHGPGGGGGGGMIIHNVPGATLISNIAGGDSGKTANGAGITHGATGGSNGQFVPIANSSDPFASVNDESCLPLVSVWKTTTTPQILQGGKATYKITVSNAPGRTTATNVNVQDVLPTGFAFDNEISVNMDTGVTQTSSSSPTVGATTANWGTFTIPTGKKVEITFQALANTTIAPGAYNNPASATYYDPQLLTTAGTKTVSYDSVANAGEDVQVVSPPVDPKISGTVFEDRNYGGGAGRPLTVAGATPRPGAVVELYSAMGAFVATTTTDANGQYEFTLGSGNFQVRVVNRTVTSGRTRNTGNTDALLPVQTFRTDGTTGTPVAVVNRVGGEKPENSDPDVNVGTQTIANLNAVTQSEVQSLAPVTVGTTNINGLDFGFNFDTIVNTRDTGHGSLREFIKSSNALSNTGLVQVGQTPGKEVSIFMVPLPASPLPLPAGMRSGLTNQLDASGRVVIKLSSAALLITDSNTSIDGRTQTNNVGDTNSLTLGAGGTVGVGDLPLSQVQAPEVEIISDASPPAKGIDVNGANATIRGISIHGFGNQGDILIRASNALVTENVIGATALSFVAPASNKSQSGIVIDGTSATNANITKNLIGFTQDRGIWGKSTADFSGLNISDNEIQKPGNGAGTVNQHSAIELFPNTTGSVNIIGNLLTDAQADSGIAIRPLTSGTTTNFLIQNNSILRNGGGNVSGFGILLQAATTNATADLQGIKIDQNIIDRNRRGINSQQTAVTIASNVVSNSLGGYGIAIEANKQKNVITKNSIFGNVGIGIDLNANGISANNGSLSTTSNAELDYPLISSAVLNSGTLTVKGYVGNNPAGNSTFGNLTLEFFIADNNPADQNGEVVVGDLKMKPHGEGKTYIGSCTTDANGFFGNSTPCAFTNAGTLGLTLASNITATATTNPTSGNGNTSEFSAIPSIRANLLLAKRITAIKKITGGTTTFNSYVNDPITVDDDVANWPGVNSYVVGVIDGGAVQPGDEIEYTVYYLNNGENRIGKARICDGLSTNLDFVDSFDSSHLNQGILFSPNGGAIQYLTGNTTDGDRGLYTTTTATTPTDCNLVNNTIADRSNNTVVVDVADSANPIMGGNYGSFKFKTTVK